MQNIMRVWILFAAVVIVAGLAVIFARLHPPKQIVLAAGPDGGAYAEIAQDYRRILARDKIRLIIRETAGSQENADLIADGIVDAAILQGGISVPGDTTEAIGTIFFEPMIFLARADLIVSRNPALWRDLRINTGQTGSGTASVYDGFQRAVGLTDADNTRFELNYADAVSALINGDLDIAVFVAPIDAPYLVDVYDEPAVTFLELDYVEAMSRRLTYANTVTVPAGAISLNPVQPPQDRVLLALEASLAISDNLHPALINRLTMAAIELHGARDILSDPNTFPSVEGTSLPVNNSARNLILSGPSAWHDWLPYWMAAQVNRMLLLLLPFIFIVLPLLRILPKMFAYFMRWRVWQYYPEIRQIEDELSRSPSMEALADMDIRLSDLDQRLAALRLPPAYRHGQYDARMHVDLVRARVAKLQRNAPAKSDQNTDQTMVQVSTGL